MAHHPTRHRPSIARRVLLAMTLSLGLSAAMPHTAAAAEDEDDHYDARVQGYQPVVESKSSSVGLVWLLLFILMGGCVGVMFMNPKRSHLD